MGPPRTNHGPTTNQPWTRHGPTMEPPMDLPWTCNGKTMDPPWTHHQARWTHRGGTTVTPWTHIAAVAHILVLALEAPQSPACETLARDDLPVLMESVSWWVHGRGRLCLNSISICVVGCSWCFSGGSVVVSMAPPWRGYSACMPPCWFHGAVVAWCARHGGSVH